MLKCQYPGLHSVTKFGDRAFEEIINPKWNILGA
jgi:hypothetical protein